MKIYAYMQDEKRKDALMDFVNSTSSGEHEWRWFIEPKKSDGYKHFLKGVKHGKAEGVAFDSVEFLGVPGATKLMYYVSREHMVLWRLDGPKGVNQPEYFDPSSVVPAAQNWVAGHKMQVSMMRRMGEGLLKKFEREGPPRDEDDE